MRTQFFKEEHSLLLVHQAPVNMQFCHRLFAQDLDLDDLLHCERHRLAIARLTENYPMDATFEVSQGNGELRFRHVRQRVLW